MLWTFRSLVIVVGLLIPGLPTGAGARGDYQIARQGDTEDPKEWNVDKFPNPNDTDHLIFDTVHSLLQHWPNTRTRNGHNIVPGTIPIGTVLYHGTYRNEIPLDPDWLSFDPEHSYYFCRGHLVKPNHIREGCWHLTLAVSRPLKVIYFDGTSAANIPYGALDTQDLIAWGKTGSGGISEEVARLQELCKWGRKLGVDGFVRMEMDFEVMVCDLTSGLKMVSFLNIVRPDGTPPNISSLTLFETIHAGSWRNHFPGETRIQLDLSGLVSFYDTQLAPSLVPVRANQERWDHRVANASDEDVLAVKSRLEMALTRSAGRSSGIDWKTLIRVIVDRFAKRLELTRYLLDLPARTPEEIIDRANKTQTQLRVMLTPYLQLSTVPADPSNETASEWTIPIYRECATVHTSFIETLQGSMTDSESLILRAIQGTSREICRVVTKMWASGVYVGIDAKLLTRRSFDVAELRRIHVTWAEDLDRLMKWLDWSLWIKCDPACDPTEICYLPTWPVGFPNSPNNQLPSVLSPHASQAQERLSIFDLQNVVKRGIAEEVRNTVKPDAHEWIRPQPKCIRRVDPYEF